MIRLWSLLSLNFRRHLRGKSLLVLCVCALALAIWDSLRPNDFLGVRQIHQQLLAPVHQGLNQLGAWGGAPVLTLQRFFDQAQRIATLEQDNARLQQWYHIAQSVLQENQNLRQNFASPLLREIRNVQHFVLRGQRPLVDQLPRFDITPKTNILPHQVVMNAGGMIGRVAHVHPYAAEVMLLGHPQSRVPVQIGAQGYQAILAGKGSNMAVLLYDDLPHDTQIRVGMQVESSDYLGLLPPRLPIGTIYAQQHGQWLVKLHFDMQKLRYIALLPSGYATHRPTSNNTPHNTPHNTPAPSRSLTSLQP